MVADSTDKIETLPTEMKVKTWTIRRTDAWTDGLIRELKNKKNRQGSSVQQQQKKTRQEINKKNNKKKNWGEGGR